MLVSIHMPKTAGSSFRATLEAEFGEQFLADYADYPLASTPLERHTRALEDCMAAEPAAFAGVSCLHGHFLPLKYLLLADQVDCRFVTWLRDPLDRLVSHYDYWQRSYDPASADTSSLHRRVVEERWSLERFCLAPELRNVYTEFLWGFPLHMLDFVGITEFYNEDLREFAALFLSGPVEALNLNVSQQARGAEQLPPRLRERVRAFHRADVELYQWALRQRRSRLSLAS